MKPTLYNLSVEKGSFENWNMMTKICNIGWPAYSGILPRSEARQRDQDSISYNHCVRGENNYQTLTTTVWGGEQLPDPHNHSVRGRTTTSPSQPLYEQLQDPHNSSMRGKTATRPSKQQYEGENNYQTLTTTVWGGNNYQTLTTGVWGGEQLLDPHNHRMRGRTTTRPSQPQYEGENNYQTLTTTVWGGEQLQDPHNHSMRGRTTTKPSHSLCEMENNYQTLTTTV